MNQNQCVDFALCYQVRADCRFTKRRCGAEYAGIMFQHFRGGFCLPGVQCAFEIYLNFATNLAFIPCCICNAGRVQLRGQLFRTAARQMDIFPDIFSAENDARNIAGGKPKRFLFVKLRIAVCRQPPQGVLQTWLQACGVNVNAVGKRYWNRLRGILFMKQHRRFFPRLCGFLHIFRFRKHAQLAVCTPKRGLFLNKSPADFLHGFQVFPLIGIGVPVFVHKGAVALLKCLPLQRQCNQIAQAAVGEMLLRRQHTVIGFEVF